MVAIIFFFISAPMDDTDVNSLMQDIEQLHREMNALHDRWIRKQEHMRINLILRVFAVLTIWQWFKLQRFVAMLQSAFQAEGIDLLTIVYVSFLLSKLQI